MKASFMKILKGFMLLFISALISCSGKTGEITVTGLKVEYLVNPLGIDIPGPRLMWKMKPGNDEVFNQKQTFYQILVASSPDRLTSKAADLWNSGRVESDQNAQIFYDGKPLESMMVCYWKVKVWNQANKPSPWSEPAFWRMGLLEERDWQAQWIGDEPDPVQHAYREYLDNYDPGRDGVLINTRPLPPPCPMLRKTLTVSKEVKSAFLYASALGYYEMWVNGQKAGDQVLAPEWTNFDKRVQYQVYDVSKYLPVGDNVLSAVLGDGWYLGMLGPTKWHADYPLRGFYGNDRRLIAQLVIDFQDGSRQVVGTDGSWKINTDGYIIDADNFLGQTIDARQIPAGWKEAEFDDAHWDNVYVDTSVGKNLEAQKNEPIRVYDTISPVRIDRKGNKYIIDFGQNLAGWTRLKIKGNSGDTLALRHGEMLQEDGSLYTANLEAAIQEDYYILSGGEDTFEPTFTYHGFRYVEISGLKDAPGKDMIRSVAISSDPEVTGSFECSNPKLNQLWSNILWTQRSNMTSVPTDCPQRDERMGWMGDAQVFCQASMFNMDMAAFYTKWLKDIRDEQSSMGAFPDIAPHANYPDIRFTNAPAWADAGVIIPWRMYQNYGDTELLRQHYSAMKRYLENIARQNPDFLWLNDVGNQYGDWLNANTIIAEGYSNTRGEVPREVFNTAFYANSVRLFSQMAALLNYEKDAADYLGLFGNIRQKFNDTYVDDEGRIRGDTQSAYALALNFDLLPVDKRQKAFEHLIRCIEEYDYRISTGFVTTIMMMNELVRWGRTDIAWQLLESERFPSWIYSINQGATTIWERWDGYVKGRGFQNAHMNSFNHYSIGAVGEWMVRHMLGINPDDRYPGFRHFIIHPRPGGTITWARGSYNSINGMITSDWHLKDGKFILDVEIPVNTSATVVLPAENKNNVRLNSKPVSSGLVNMDHRVAGELALELGSGKYSIEVIR
jgi:alpha-L-rhamnosidase